MEKATVAITLANTASASGDETFVFMTCDAVQLVMKTYRDGRWIAGYATFDELMAHYIAASGRFWVYADCAKARGIVPEDLIDSAELVDATRTVSFLNEGGRVVM